MNRMISIAAAGLALVAVLSAAPAAAQGARSFVSAHGNDSNTCSIVAPCRTFAGAYSHTNPSGEITVLDPAGYGPLTITTALSIVNDGVGEAGVILIAAGNAITINAGSSDPVSLRGLTLDGGGVAGTNGIVFNSGKSLTVVNCVIRHTGNDGILVSTSANASINISDTIASDNSNGIEVTPTGTPTIHVSLTRVQLVDNGARGLLLDGLTTSGGAIRATAVNSGFVGGGNPVVVTSDVSKANLSLSLTASWLTNSNTAIFVNGATAAAYLSQTTISGNVSTFGLNGGGTLFSYGDNYLADNTLPTGTGGTLTSVARK